MSNWFFKKIKIKKKKKNLLIITIFFWRKKEIEMNFILEAMKNKISLLERQNELVIASTNKILQVSLVIAFAFVINVIVRKEFLASLVRVIYKGL